MRKNHYYLQKVCSQNLNSACGQILQIALGITYVIKLFYLFYHQGVPNICLAQAVMSSCDAPPADKDTVMTRTLRLYSHFVFLVSQVDEKARPTKI